MSFLQTEKKKVLNIGELLLRISLDNQGLWLDENNFSCFVGGAEVNVASALALWEVPVALLTALPDNDMSAAIQRYLQSKNIDTSFIQLSGKRLGLYFLEQGKDLKNAGVIYDRAESSFATIDRAKIDWDEILSEVSWLHLSAICPAINQHVADFCLDAVQAAHAKGIFVSFDLNYRSKLWKYGKQPIDIIPHILSYCDLIMGNIWAAHQMAGADLAPIFWEDLHYGQEVLERQAEQTSRDMISKYLQCKYVALTFRFDQKQGIRYFTTLFSQDHLSISKIWEKEKISNKIGSGDCFMAGLIYGLYQNLTIDQTLEFSTAAAVDKLDIESDATTSNKDAILQQIKQNN